MPNSDEIIGKVEIKRRTRKVFGRVEKEIDGKMMTFEMNKSGLTMHELYSRSEPAKVTFNELADFIKGQGKLL